MISAIRNKFGSRLLDIFIWLAIIAFVLLYIAPGGQKAQRSEQWAVTVDGESSTYREYQGLLDANRRSQKGIVDTKLSGRQKEEQNRKDAVDALTKMLLMQKAEKSLNIQLGSDMVGNKILKLLPGGEIGADGKVSMDYIKKMVGGDDQLAMIEIQIEKDIKAEVVGNALIGGLYIPKFAMDNYYRSEYAFKKFSILTVSYKDAFDAVGKKAISEKELKDFFVKQNKKSGKYLTSETRSADVWTFSSEDFGVKVSERQIKNYYNRYRTKQFVKQEPQMQIRRILFEVDKDKDENGEILAAAQDKAGEIRALLASDSGKFEELAKKHSDDKLTAAKGGLLDFFGKGEREKKLVEAAFELRVDGEISEIIETGRGVEIIQRVARKSIKFKSLEDVKSEIKQKVTEQQFKKLFDINARRVIARSVKDASLFSKFVESKKSKKATLSSITDTDNNKNTKKLFSLKKINSKGFLVDGNSGTIVVMTSLDKSKAKDFSKIKSEVEADLKKTMAISQVEKQLKKAVSEIKDGKDLKEVATKMNAEYEKTQLISRNAFGKIGSLRKKGIPLEALWSLNSKGSYQTKVAENSDTPNGYLIRMDLMQKSAKEDFASKRKSILRSLFGMYRAGLDVSFIDSLRKDATIKVNTAVINV
jgi:parvulin-like peptidyl-prolyl isomerase